MLQYQILNSYSLFILPTFAVRVAPDEIREIIDLR